MASGKVRIKLTGVFISDKAVRPREDVSHRLLFQLFQPAHQGDNPTVTFAGAFQAGEWDVNLEDLVIDGYIFKGQPYDLADDEKLRIRIHYYQDVEHDWLQRTIGRLIELSLKAALSTAKVFGVSLAEVISGSDSLGLSEKVGTLKLGFFDLALSVAELAAGLVARQVELVAPLDVVRPEPLGPGTGLPPRVPFARKGDVTAKVRLEVIPY
jgi:hypothetical protein